MVAVYSFALAMALVLFGDMAAAGTASQAGGAALPDVAHLPAASRPAIGAAVAAVSAAPADANRWGALADVLHAWEQWDAAADAYREAVRLDPRRGAWLYCSALVEERRGNAAAAAQFLKRAIAALPDYLPARLRLAERLLDAGRTDDARAAFEPLVAVPETAAAALYGRARIHALAREHEAAVTDFEAAIARFPEFGAAWYGLGLALRDLGRLEPAQVALTKAKTFGARWPAVDDPIAQAIASLRTDPQAHLTRGIRLDALGDLDGAIREHEAAITGDPTLAQAHLNLITLYGRRGDVTKAQSEYDAAVRLGSTPAEAHYNYGVALLQADRVDDAVAKFTAALEADPLHARAANNLGQALERLGRVQDAEAQYRRAVSADPGNDVARFNLVRVLLARTALDEAERHVGRLLAVDTPERARYLFAQATIAARRGDRDGARRYATQARDLAMGRGQTALAEAIARDLERLP